MRNLLKKWHHTFAWLMRVWFWNNRKTPQAQEWQIITCSHWMTASAKTLKFSRTYYEISLTTTFPVKFSLHVYLFFCSRANRRHIWSIQIDILQKSSTRFSNQFCASSSRYCIISLGNGGSFGGAKKCNVKNVKKNIIYINYRPNPRIVSGTKLNNHSQTVLRFHKKNHLDT